jgi:hypothetical protein
MSRDKAGALCAPFFLPSPKQLVEKVALRLTLGGAALALVFNTSFSRWGRLLRRKQSFRSLLGRYSDDETEIAY